MAKQLAFANLLYFVLVIQPLLTFFSVDPNFRPWLPGFALVVYLVFADQFACLVWSALLGIGVDCLSIHGLGINAVVTTCIAASWILIREDSRSRGIAFAGFFTFLVTFIWLNLATIFRAMLEGHGLDITTIMALSSTGGVSTAMLVIALLSTCWAVKNCFQPPATSSIVLANRWSMLTGK